MHENLMSFNISKIQPFRLIEYTYRLDDTNTNNNVKKIRPDFPLFFEQPNKEGEGKPIPFLDQIRRRPNKEATTGSEQIGARSRTV